MKIIFVLLLFLIGIQIYFFGEDTTRDRSIELLFINRLVKSQVGILDSDRDLKKLIPYLALSLRESVIRYLEKTDEVCNGKLKDVLQSIPAGDYVYLCQYDPISLMIFQNRCYPTHVKNREIIESSLAHFYTITCWQQSDYRSIITVHSTYVNGHWLVDSIRYSNKLFSDKYKIYNFTEFLNRQCLNLDKMKQWADEHPNDLMTQDQMINRLKAYQP